MEKRLLILSSDKETKKLLNNHYSNSGFIVTMVDKGKSCISQIEKESYDIILADYNIKDMNAEELIKNVKREHKHIEIIIMTNKEELDGAIELIQIGAFDYTLKPVDVEKATDCINRAILKQSEAYQFVAQPVSGKKKGKLPTLKRGAGVYIDNNNIYFSEVEWSLQGPNLTKKVWANFSRETFGYQVERFFSERLRLKKSEKKASVSENGIIKEKKVETRLKKENALIKKIISIAPTKIKSKIDEVKNKIQVLKTATSGKKKKLIDPLLLREKKKESILFTSGIPGQSVFFTSFLMSSEGAKKLDENLLITENPRLAFINSTNVVWDATQLKVKKNLFAFVAASRLKPSSMLLQSFYESGFQPSRVEPEPWATLRASLYYSPARAKKGAEIRFIFGELITLSVLFYNMAPLAWQTLELNQREKYFDNLYSSVITMSNYATGNLRVEEVEVITLQGGDNLNDKASALEKLVEKPVMVVKGPSYDGHLIALGLALGSLAHDILALNIVKKIQKPLNLKLLFPRGEAIITAFFVLLVLLIALLRLDSVDKNLLKVKRLNAMAGLPPRKTILMLGSERDKLKAVVEPIGKFLGDKTNWTNYLLELPKLVPLNTRIVGIEVEDQIWQKLGGTTYGQRYLLISMATEFIGEGKTPQAIDETLNIFRDAKVFKEEFPKMDLATIFWKKEYGVENAFFSMVALPKQKEK